MREAPDEEVEANSWGPPWRGAGGVAAAMESGGSCRHEFDLDVRDLGKEPVRISLAAVCVCE